MKKKTAKNTRSSKNAYRIISMISASPNATVYKAESPPFGSNTVVAIKAMDFPSGGLIADRDPSLFHRNLLHVHRLFLARDGRVWAVMPFFSAGSLRSIIPYRSPRGLPEPTVAAVLKQVLRALVYLHACGEFHRNIKPGNIVLSHGTSTVKLADFGISKSFYSKSSSGGRPYWKAPERKVGEKSDVWAFGVTAMELAHGGPPLRPDRLGLVSESVRLEIRRRFGWSTECEERYCKDYVEKKRIDVVSEDFSYMVGSCLDQDPSKRPSAEDLLGHRFFSEVDEDSDSLIRDLLAGVPSVEKRLNEFNVDPGESLGQSGVECVAVGSWEFDRAGFKLEPVLRAEPGSDSEDETMSEGTDEWDDSDEWDSDLDWDESDELDPVLKTAIETIQSVDRRWAMVTRMILEMGGSESGELSKEEETAKRIEEMENELEVQTRRRTELEAECKSLRGQLSSSGEETK